MATDKELLNKSDLEEYTKFCLSKGWKLKNKPNIKYEVLRMTNTTARHPLIVYTSSKQSDFYTVYRDSLIMCNAFLAAKQSKEL